MKFLLSLVLSLIALPAFGETIDFHKDVASILREYCAGCHNDIDLEGEFSVETFKTLMKGGESGEELPGRRVLINPCEMKPNPAIPEAVWEKLTSLPSQTLPKKQARPVKRLTALAHELAMDDILPDAGKKAHEAMHEVLDTALESYDSEIAEARASVMTVEGKTLSADTKTIRTASS